MQLSVLPLFLFITTILADGASILAAISSITNDTLALNHTVASWSGDPLGALPILIQATTLLSTINSGTRTASSSANLTDLETIGVAQATITLVSDVQSTLNTIVTAKPKFATLLVAPVIELNLLEEKAATDKFSAAVINKVPAAFQGAAATIVAPVDVAFTNAIAAYKGVL